MKQTHFYWLILLLLAASCTPKGLPKTTQDFKEDLTTFRPQYKYEKDVYQGEGVIVRLPAPMDTSANQFDITASLNNYLDTEVIIYRPAIEVVYREGYRIQIYRGRSRTEAERAKQRSYELFPRITPYLTYSSPTYRVQVGDFLETNEYINIYNRLKREFPAALVIPDIVKVVIMNDPGSTYEDEKKKKK